MISGTFERRRAISAQSHVSPVPPRSVLVDVSSRWKSVWKRSSACMSARSATRAALMTCAPVRRRDLVAERGALVAVQLHHRQPERVDGR